MSTMKPTCFEFKFDDTRLSSKYKNKIGPIEIFENFIWANLILMLCLVSSNLNSKQLKFHLVNFS